MKLAALLATITLVIFIGVASFGPMRVRMVLMRASTTRFGSLGLFWLYYVAVGRAL
jgi:hypothetical protein